MNSDGTIFDPDRDAVLASQKGDNQAFSILVHRYSSMVYSLAARSLGFGEDAEDAVQDIFLKAFRGLTNFDPQRRFYPWLYSLALNHLRSLLRKRSFRSLDHLPLNEELVSGPEVFGPEAHLQTREARDLITRGLARLKTTERRVFLLRQVRGLSTEETARLLGIPENTVKTRLRRARQNMAKHLTQDETFSPSMAYISTERKR